MPIYEYRCRACGKDLEVMQKITEDPLTGCPYCGGELQRLISNTGFILKGTGWYVTDYARKDSSNKKGKASEGSGESSDKKTSSSDTKKEP
jgi:putative FmdB family regulatory protein